MIRSIRIAQILALTACCGWGLAQAQQMQAQGHYARGPIEQNWQFDLGSFFLTSDTKLKVNGDTVEGSDVNWENEFDLKDKDQFRLDAFWRFAERHKIRAMWFQNNRSGSRTLTRDISFQDQVYPVTTTVRASLDEEIIELAYEYAFYRTDKLELSGSGGIHALKFGASLSGQIATPGGGGGSTQVSRDGSVTGPLPVIGFRVLWDMGHNLYLDGMAQFFYISFDNFDGSITDTKVTVTWMPWRNFGFGLGYNYFTTRVNVSKNDFDGRIKFGYDGGMAFVTFAF
jgi:hypothetical protein